jgi:hypothetical protein
VAAAEYNTVRQSLRAVQRQLQKRLDDRNRLSIAAPIPGVIIPPQPIARSDDSAVLPTWSGTPLQSRNLGAYLNDGVLFCQIGDPSRLQAVLTIDQTDIEQVRQGLPVEFTLDQWPSRVWRGAIEHVSEREMDVAPRALSTQLGGRLPTVTDSTGQQRPLQTTYQASVPLDQPAADILIGGRGVARIQAGSRCAASRLWLFLCQTFHLL